MKKISAFFLLLMVGLSSLFVWDAQGAIFNAMSCSEKDVNEAINSVSQGDTVVVPEGKCEWSAGVDVPDGVTLQGAGIGKTVISSSSFITTSLGNKSRISELEFTNGLAMGKCTQGWVADFCKFSAAVYDSNGQGIGGTSCSEHPTGVYHKCTIEHIRFRVRGTAVGTKDWYTNYPPLGGTDHVIYWEGCTFNSYGDYTNGIDSNYGGAKVIRFCTISNQPMGSHGGRAPDARGTVRHSMYRNTFYFSHPDTPKYAWWFRGGSGMFFDNKCYDYGSTHCRYEVDFERGYDTRFAICADGTGYETVPHPRGDSPKYLCRDGIGAGKDLGPNPSGSFPYGQEPSPLYIWNQIVNDLPSPIAFKNKSSSYVNENRDYFLDDSLGAGGVKIGTWAERPTCNASSKNHGYWATDMGENWNSTDEWGGTDGALYVCDGDGTWKLYYTPAPYPHPLVQAREKSESLNSSDAPSKPSDPASLVIKKE
jgi:hypothetical protein